MITLLGGSGYVGGAIRKALDQRELPYRSISRSELDYYQPEKLAAWLQESETQFLINAAGYTGRPNVDACESDKCNCLNGNAILPGRVAEACKEADIPWGQVSSGCIYTGRPAPGEGFTEEDEPNFSFRKDNCSFYSGTKALGEEVLANEENVYIWRLRIPFNELDGARNFLSKLMRYAKLLEAENSITQLDEFANVCIDSWVKQIPYGIYNITNPGHITTRQVAGLITEHGLAPHEFSFFESESDFMQKAAIAPRSNCVLNTDKLEAAGIHMTPIEEALHQALDNWVPEAS